MDDKQIPGFLQELDYCPPGQRSWCGDVIAYHITTPDRLDGIRRDGLKALSSRQSYDRPPAVYFFLDPACARDIRNVKTLLGDVGQYILLTVRLPVASLALMRVDWLYVMSYPFGWSSIALDRDVPPSWIASVEECS